MIETRSMLKARNMKRNDPPVNSPEPTNHRMTFLGGRLNVSLCNQRLIKKISTVEVTAAMAAAKTGDSLPPNPQRTVTSLNEKSRAARNGKISSVFFHQRPAPSQEIVASPATIRPTPASTKGPGRSPRSNIASTVENIGVVL